MQKTSSSVSSVAHPSSEKGHRRLPNAHQGVTTLNDFNGNQVASDPTDLARWEASLRQWEAMLKLRESRLEERERSSSVSLPEERDQEAKLHSSSLSHYLRSGRFLRSMVFGGLDGVTTTMVLVCSVSGIGGDGAAAHISAGVVFTLGTANAIADAFSMGMGELLSSLAEGDAEESPSARLDAVRNGLVMFLSFIIFGFLPLLAYMSFAPVASREMRFRLAWSLCISGLFALGVMKGIVTGAATLKGSVKGLAKSGVTMVATGGIASALSYVISEILHHDVPPLAG